MKACTCSPGSTYGCDSNCHPSFCNCPRARSQIEVGYSDTRYFLSQDNSSHWYIVPCEEEREWNRWKNLPEDNEESWQSPDFARRLNGHLSFLTFTMPTEDMTLNV